jgi:hypothetical protein
MRMPNLSIKNFNIWTILSLLFLIAGISFWIYWGTRYNVWYDIGPYSVIVVFIIPGIVGTILSLMGREEVEEN